MNRKHGLKKFLCVALCAACLPVAFAQDAEKREMSAADLEKMARFLLGDEIRAGKLTLKQGADYVKCTQDTYAKDFYHTPAGEKYLEAVGRLFDGEKKSAQETARLQAETDRLLPELKKYQNKAEETCMKQLGVSVPKGKVFGQQ
ncbi:MAG: hypothetical protein LBE85_09495 [Candidatus Accumulibacter sp.]|jgi:hypothetical protein|nr:hypothetical protein [Accumulibacter sp.]